MKFKSNYAHPVTLFIGTSAIRLEAYGEYETDDPGVIMALRASEEVSRVREPKPETKAEEPKADAPPTKNKKGSVEGK